MLRAGLQQWLLELSCMRPSDNCKSGRCDESDLAVCFANDDNNELDNQLASVYFANDDNADDEHSADCNDDDNAAARLRSSLVRGVRR